MLYLISHASRISNHFSRVSVYITEFYQLTYSSYPSPLVEPHLQSLILSK